MLTNFTIFNNLDNFWQFLTIFNNLNNFWQFWPIFTILTIFTIFYKFDNLIFFTTLIFLGAIFTFQTILPFCQMKRQSWRLVTFETLITILTNWEPEFMTIIVTWQLIVTLDSIRNSCDVLQNTRFLLTVKNPNE